MSRYPDRESKHCGSWRPTERAYPITGRPRLVCTRPHRPDDPVHWTPTRAHWWTDNSREVHNSAEHPPPVRG